MNKDFTSDEHEIDGWFDDDLSETNSFFASMVDPAEKYAASQLRVVRETRDYQLDYLKHALQPGRQIIDTSPGYQRRLRWTNKKRSLLIESFLLNIPVPPIFLFERDYGEYEVIDGRQRIETIHAFFSNEFPLNSLEYWSELNNKRFTELPVVLQRGLLRRSISAIVLLAETDKGAHELDVRRVLFDRLNTGGIKLNPQELRNALYPGTLNALLIKLARTEHFTATWNIPKYKKNEENEPSEELLKNSLFSTMADAELVLRFFALQDAFISGKTGSLRRILDRYMELNKDIDESEQQIMQSSFIDSIKRLYMVFDGEPFKLPKTRRPSRPLYDALMIALSINPGLDVENRKSFVVDKLASALANEESYEILIGRGNTIEAVRQRILLAIEILSA
ncbi:DUF262 domain-containing protein [Aeromonas caviae]|uniref:DUF262 domain-containing protein n=1 Tax=Aeromonas caviae TaxID=648 RepID=A0AA42R7E1_AERCA|nr:DUF262 domain-containing protein [Aeromonas caviae]MDH0435757.1 DUF262 domain-containing protein [Aeromonas caviae]MDH0938602.1 DUF262 domain-containing protein [Aeromonas caviae]MDH1399435.1 DUF262 domain-containing protein [Aeromonas caviae]MDH1505383.1 DUF262 domain-containing protein [Aeromonas caviae]MDH1852219.1 DUF262 domain-containing protein [Aeromonas caviae]